MNSAFRTRAMLAVFLLVTGAAGLGGIAVGRTVQPAPLQPNAVMLQGSPCTVTLDGERSGTCYGALVETVMTPSPTPEPTPTTAPTPTPTLPPASSPPAPQPSLFSLQISSSPDGSAPSALAGKTVSGGIYVFVLPDSEVTQVRFAVDGVPSRTENLAPFTLAGDNAGVTNPFDTTTLTNGSHTVSAEVDRSGGTDVLSAGFTVANQAAPTPPPSPSPTPTPTPAPTAPPTPTTAPTPTPVPSATSTTAPTPTPASTNLILNEGFENGNWSWAMDPGATVDTAAANARTGSGSLKLVATAAWQGTSQFVPVTAGRTYSISGWARSTSGLAYITLISFNASFVELGVHTDLILAGTGSWRSSSASYVPPTGATQVWVGMQSSGSGTFWFDDLSLTAGPAPVPTATPVPTVTPVPTATPAPTPGAGLSGLHVQGNKLLNASNQTVVLHGVNKAGSEYMCVGGGGGGGGVFDGPFDQASVLAIKSWRTNAVRIGLNEHCWHGINGAPQGYSAATYQTAIKNYVNLLNQNGLYAILELHWSAPGSQLAMGQQPMMDMDHTPTFWSQVANAFKNNTAVIFEPHNEPYPDGGAANTTAAWTCWRDGGTCSGMSFQAAGMQTIVNTIRSTGATNVIALGGLRWSNYLTQWLAYKPSDPLNNLVAAWHTYDFNTCNTVSCYNSTVGVVAAVVPVIATEIGTESCNATFMNTLMNWLDSKQLGYLAWQWQGPPGSWYNTSCSEITLISDFTGTPTTYGLIYKQHLAILP